MNRRCLATISLVILALSGCEAKGAFNDNSVIGPDLAHAGPFDGVHQVVMTEPASSSHDLKPARFTIHRADVEDTGQEDTGKVENMFSNTSKPFDAGVSYYPFTPIVAETNAEARTYWLVGINMTRTADRSVYMILRYPSTLVLTPGLRSDAFEYLAVTCGDLDIARHPADYYKPLADGEQRAEPPLDPAPEAGDCEFNSLAEAHSLPGLVLRKYDQIRHFDSAPTANWQTVHVEID